MLSYYAIKNVYFTILWRGLKFLIGKGVKSKFILSLAHKASLEHLSINYVFISFSVLYLRREVWEQSFQPTTVLSISVQLRARVSRYRPEQKRELPRMLFVRTNSGSAALVASWEF